MKSDNTMILDNSRCKLNIDINTDPRVLLDTSIIIRNRSFTTVYHPQLGNGEGTNPNFRFLSPFKRLSTQRRHHTNLSSRKQLSPPDKYFFIEEY
jgi:hypothetical protein